MLVGVKGRRPAGDDVGVIAFVQLGEAQARTLHEMGILHPRPHAPQYTQAL